MSAAKLGLRARADLDAGDPARPARDVLRDAGGDRVSSIERLAIEIRHLQRTEVLEAEEYFSPGQKGSSAMPHKRNPVLTENLTGLARLVRMAVVPAMENVALWHERDISHSIASSAAIGPDATVTLDFALARLTGVIEQLVVYPENMLRNMNRFRGLIHSQRVLLALTQKGVSREDAYRARAAQRDEGLGGGRGLRGGAARADPEVRAALPRGRDLGRCSISAITRGTWTRSSRGCSADGDAVLGVRAGLGRGRAGADPREPAGRAVAGRRGEYYAHPQNAFWRLVGAAIGVDLAALPYAARLAALRDGADRGQRRARLGGAARQPRRGDPRRRGGRPRRRWSGGCPNCGRWRSTARWRRRPGGAGCAGRGRGRADRPAVVEPGARRRCGSRRSSRGGRRCAAYLA